jgi:hypothetical protein
MSSTRNPSGTHAGKRAVAGRGADGLTGRFRGGDTTQHRGARGDRAPPLGRAEAQAVAPSPSRPAAVPPDEQSPHGRVTPRWTSCCCGGTMMRPQDRRHGLPILPVLIASTIESGCWTAGSCGTVCRGCRAGALVHRSRREAEPRGFARGCPRRAGGSPAEPVGREVGERGRGVRSGVRGRRTAASEDVAGRASWPSRRTTSWTSLSFELVEIHEVVLGGS